MLMMQVMLCDCSASKTAGMSSPVILRRAVPSADPGVRATARQTASVWAERSMKLPAMRPRGPWSAP